MGRTLLVLAVLGCTACCSQGFSFSRTLHDVAQDVAEDTSLYSHEMRLNTPELGLPTNAQKNQLENYLTIRESPPSYVRVTQGQRIELKCEIDGNPPPRVYWITGENPGKKMQELERESVADFSYASIAREVSKLVIECATPLDQGLVHCVGVAGDKMVISQPTVITVEPRRGNIDEISDNSDDGSDSNNGNKCESRVTGSGQEPPVITRHRPYIFSEIGSSIELPCESSGSPRPRVHWLDGENKRIDDPRFSVQPDGSLLMSSIRWQDMDAYKCVASSPLGRAEASTFLYPAAKSESNKRKTNAL